jgi:microcystin degradation protein MlrC
MTSIEQLVHSIDGRIRELNHEIASLENARSALVSNGSAPTPSQKPRAKQAARRKPRKATKVLLADTAERMLAGGDGLTTTALAKHAGADRAQVLALLRDLEASRRVRRTGERRATRWYVITDEDRIEKRAAELESRSRRRGSSR